MPASGYTVITFVADELLTSTKMNQMGANDAAFNNGNGFNDSIIVARHIASNIITSAKIDWAASTGKIWWEELGRATAAGTVTSLSVASIAAKKYLKIILVAIPTGGTLNIGVRFNNDSSTNYAERGSINGSADATGTSLNQINTKTAVDALRQLTTLEFQNVASSAKLGIAESILEGTSGAGSAPERKIGVYKWHNTSVQITRVDMVDTGGTGDIATGSELIVLGHD